MVAGNEGNRTNEFKIGHAQPDKVTKKLKSGPGIRAMLRVPMRKVRGYRRAHVLFLVAIALFASFLIVFGRRLSLSEQPWYRPQARILPGTDDTVDRAHVVAALHHAVDVRQFECASFLNSLLAQEALQRSLRVLKAWEQLRDPETGLVPEAIHPWQPYWSTNNAAADLFPFLLLAGHYVDRDNRDIWVEAIATERKICGPMPCYIYFKPTRVKSKPSQDVLSHASEYAKDGLLAITERLGKGPWLERMEEVMGILIDAADVETSMGNICSIDCEVNGEMLQVLTRLYWLTGRDEYLEMAERIGRAYLFEVLPANNNLPCEYFDFAESRPVVPEVRLRDHGNEVIVGLAELYFLEKMKGRPEAAVFREPIKGLLDLLLEVGRTEDGLWYSRIDTSSYEVLDDRVIDAWGYLLTAYRIFDLAEGSDTYGPEIKRAMLAAESRKSFSWEGTHDQDGYADAIESMLYMLPTFDIPECHLWVDEEIANLFSKQRSSGIIDRNYLAGNFVRTALLYAKYKTQGIMADRWREDLRLGAVRDKRKGELYVCLSASSDWEGVLMFDPPRHRTIWKLPFEYPRLNGAPEWFTVVPDATYRVIDLETGEKSLHAGRTLARGMPVRLSGANPSLFLKVTMVRGGDS